MFRVELSMRAEFDLKAIAMHIATERGADFADNYINKLIDRIETLSYSPRRTRERTELGRGQHALLIDAYMAFYRIEGDVVLIQRVLHGSQRITKRLIRD